MRSALPCPLLHIQPAHHRAKQRVAHALPHPAGYHTSTGLYRPQVVLLSMIFAGSEILHAVNRNAQDDQIFTLDLLFLNELNDRAAVRRFNGNSDFCSRADNEPDSVPYWPCSIR